MEATDVDDLYYVSGVSMHMEELIHEDGTSLAVASLKFNFTNIKNDEERETVPLLFGMSDLIELGALIDQAQVRLIDLEDRRSVIEDGGFDEDIGYGTE